MMRNTKFTKRGQKVKRLLVVAGTVAVTGANLVALSSPAAAATRSDIATLALQNVGLGDCSTNSRGSVGFETSCTRHEYWCADFVMWVWQSLGIDVAGLDAGARSFQAYGASRNLLTNTPEVGDAVYFKDSSGVIRHVAVVTEVNPDGTIRSASGDLGGQSGSMAHFADTSISRHDLPYPAAIGSYSAAVGWYVGGYTRPQGVVNGSVGGEIAVKYNQLGGAAGFLGSPITDELTTPNSPWGVGRYNHFQNNGSIYWTAPTGAHEVHGVIRNEWAAIGWEQKMGFPTSDETATPNSPWGVGRYNSFQDGSIYWTPATGAHEVQGIIYKEWAAIGWEQKLGFPTTDETTTPDGIGRYNHFQIGSIYWTPATGAHEVQGVIRDKWAALGWEASVLGYPTSDELTISAGKRSNFQHGYIIWKAATNTTTAYHTNGTPIQ